ncbi:hypothetical protein BGZ98_002017 [Dissophora globulifera]|nr:hypothetical protein BGZ98_002017 [Dissophora globulifera]
MANSNVTAVYRFVIDDVITNVRRDFEDMGVDETIMHELQRSWETKIAQSRVASFQAPEPVAAVEVYPFEESGYEQPPGASTSAAAPVSALGSATSTYSTPPLASYNYRVEQTPAANLANVAPSTLTGDNSNTDGAADMAELEFMSTAELDAYVEKRFKEAREAETEVTFTLTLSDRAARKAKRDGLEGFAIGQVDGEEDDDDDTGLGSDLDDSDGDMDDESDNVVLCQYDKVSRTKSKWKCVLKDGIMLINGRDYLFHKANGDFEW